MATRPRPGDALTSLSIIIPAYNEERRLAPTLRSVLAFAAGRTEATEVIVVDDGSTDRTVEICRAIGGPRVRLIAVSRNRGKGATVRSGMLAATGEHRLFTDADGATPIDDYAALAEALERAGGSGVAFGSIGLKEARVLRRKPGVPNALGKLGNLLIQALVLPGVHDSQRGFKLFSADVAEDVFRRSVVDGWGFDVEVLALARRLGFPIIEVPVRWTHVDGGPITPKAYPQTLADVLRIRWRLTTGTYELARERPYGVR